MKRYTAKARLSFSFADVQRKRIFYRVTSESSSSLTHAFLSEQRLENEINAVLSSALEKVIEDGERAAGFVRRSSRSQTVSAYSRRRSSISKSFGQNFPVTKKRFLRAS